MILILSGKGDIHADAVETELDAMNVEHLRFDGAKYPDESQCSIHIGRTGMVSGTLTCAVTVSGNRVVRTVDLASVSAVWVRRPGRPVSQADDLGPVARGQIAADSAAVLDDLWNLLPAFRLPATPDVIAAAAHKSEQLRRAAWFGFDIPQTWTGNSPDGLLGAVADRPARFVTKRTAPSQRMTDEVGSDISRLTNNVRPRDLTHVDGVQRCPLTVQESVDKAFELRVTVVGDQVFTAAIYSQLSNRSRHDWRRSDPAHTPIETYSLPRPVADRCVRLVRSYGLTYGAVDLIATPDGRLVFLELNPNGQYLWVEQATGQRISAAIAAALVVGAARVDEGQRADQAGSSRFDHVGGPVVHHVD